MLKRILQFLGIFLILLLAYLGIKTLLFSSVQKDYALVEVPALDEAAVARFAGAIRIKTISQGEDTPPDSAAMRELHAYLAENFPLVDSMLTRETVADLSLLYTWEGTNQAAKPIILIGHMDVVPIEEASRSEWEQAPFSGAVADGFIWGRGTLDDKVTVLTVLEAVENKLKQGFRPERTVYLSFGHDEEIGGKGARALVKTLQDRGVQAEFVLDEGGVITQGLVPGLDRDAALISIAEKGYMSLQLTVQLPEGGHSSMPPPEPAVEILARALVQVREFRPAARLSEPIDKMFTYLGPEMDFPYNVIFANQNLLGNVITDILANSSPSGNASVRTTTAPTMLSGGVKDNVLPSKVSAVINFRLLPGDDSEKMMEYVKKIIDDERVSVTRYGSVQFEATTVSSTESFGYQVIEQSIKEVFENTHVAPNLAVGFMDVRHYQPLSDDLYRFLPLRANSEDLARIHGVNERLSLDDFRKGIAFYEQLLEHGTKAE